MNKGVFLDRDGIVNVDKGYVYRKKDFTFNDDIFNLCRLLQEKKFKIFIITNQSGIGRGFYTLKDFNLLNNWMLGVFKEHDILISKIYFCPHHPTEGKEEFKAACNCRKPAPGMILQARKEFDLDLKASILIGDSFTDIQAGINAGIGQNYWVGGKDPADMNPVATVCIDDLKSLIAFLTSQFNKEK